MGKRSLRFERLEGRLLLAGDVKWALSRSGDLTITGDQNPADVDDSIEIASLGNLTYRITGIGGTTVKGEASVEIAGVKRNVIVDLKAGNDRVEFVSEGGGFAKDVTAKMGDGTDIVEATNVIIGGKLTVDMGAGDLQEVTLNGGSTVAKDVSIKMGDGDDNGVLLEQVTLNKKLTVVTGSGNDSVGVVDSTVKNNISISTGAGVDSIGLANVNSASTARVNITVKAGTNPQAVRDGVGNIIASNADRIGVAGGTAKNITLDGGDSSRKDTLPGQARIGVTGVQVTNNLTIKTGHAQDEVGVGMNADFVQELSRQLEDLIGHEVMLAEGPVAIGNTATIYTGLGADLVLLNKSSARVFKMDTGDADDQAYIRDITPPPGQKMQVTLKMGNGNDTLGLSGVKQSDFAYASIDGGAGNQDALPGVPREIGKAFPFRNWELFSEDLGT